MEEADKLCEQVFLWLKKQEQCPKKLLAAAKKLENHHSRSNKVQLVGGALAGLGFVATAATGGMPVLLALALIGATLSLTTSTAESSVSHHKFNKAEKRIEDVEEIRDTIQTLLNELNVKCASQGRGASAASSDDESDECEVTTQFMGALARKDGTDVPLDLLRRFNKTTVFSQQRLVRSDVDVNMILKAAMKRTALAPGGFVRLAMPVCDLGRNVMEIKNKRTEASRSLRTADRELEEKRRNVRKMIEAQREIIKNLEFLTLLENLGEYSLAMTEDGQKVLDFVKAECNDDAILSWVDENQIDFLNLFRFIRDHLLKHLEREIEARDLRPLHIVFVAHGCITGEFIPAPVLVPTLSITNTFLYSPWNCYIDEYAAYGIAGGTIEPDLREFYSTEEPDILLHFDHLPQRWNSIRQSTEPEIPLILLGPVTPEEPVWRAFMTLGGYVHRGDRIIIPYLQPHEETPDIPFFMLVFVASFILKITRVKATVHLAACLGREETKEPIREESRRKCAAQYFYTEDGTVMSMKTEDTDENDLLLQALRLMFNNHNRH